MKNDGMADKVVRANQKTSAELELLLRFSSVNRGQIAHEVNIDVRL